MSHQPAIPRTLPPVDERLVMPGSRYEIVDGQAIYVSPADPAHGRRHSKLAAMLEAAVAAHFDVAVDMLTRTSETGDMAPDASVFPRDPDPETGGRQLEHLAFEVVSTESIRAAGTKAARLRARGVRRVFAIDVERERALEWDVATDGWSMLAHDERIEDPCLAVPLSLREMVSAVRVDDAIAEILLARGNPVLARALAAERAAAKRESLLMLVEVRRLPLDEAQLARIAAADETDLDRYLRRILSAATAAALLGDE